jgi:hypothetical protein
MSSRERRVPLDPFEMLVRESLRERADGRLLEPEVRDQLLERAARQDRSVAWQASLLLRSLFDDRQSRFGNSVSPHHFVCLEGLFGPRASWFSFNQLTR